MSGPERNAAAVEALDAITRRLRRECPWDREQDERSIVPHTVEEAYELADAAARHDDGQIVDELGDVLFQVHFLALLLEERGAGDLAAVADACREKLIRRHPHVFGDDEADDAGTVRRNWDEIKRGERGGAGLFDDLPENLPSTLYAKKVLRRAEPAEGGPENGGNEELAFEAAGELLLEAVESVVRAGHDPELALRAAANRAAEALGERDPG